MHRALQLAEQGIGRVSPNPLVGCVIVKNDVIIAEGYHQLYGQAHAEVNAINQLPDDFDFSECTLFVNLEPCSHFGKTPPCCDLIIQKKFKRVVIANTDNNPLVAGNGIKKIKENNIEVVLGVLEKEATKLNKRFFTFHTKHRPYIILKWAETKDGYISKFPIPTNSKDNWISCDESKKIVHQWRSEEQAIMVGTNTVLNDNPQLTTRLVNGKNPTRIIIDKALKIPLASNVFENNADVIIFNLIKDELSNHVRYIKLNENNFTIEEIFKKLADLKILSILVEGGTTLLQSIIDANLWDEARVFVGNKSFENGIKAPQLNKSKSTTTFVGSDSLSIIINE
jgi:diaminohydroxyphosphoribosylaminopyrimidine deaminase/5-amino-6-(5-phosphoribosylamino)uracil reductase